MPAHTTHFTLDFTDIKQQLIHVSMEAPLSTTPKVLRLPRWIPGSYMIRDFAQHTSNLRAFNASDQGKSLALTQLSSSAWQLPAHTGAIVEYTVFANDLSVRSCYANDQFCFINGTSVFMQLVDDGNEGIRDDMKYDVRLTGLCDADIVNTTLPELETSTEIVAPYHYHVSGYHQLIEHPFLIGRLVEHRFTYRDIPITCAFNETPACALSQLEDDLMAIFEHHNTLYGDVPFQQYTFQTMLVDNGYGGLEHLDSTALMYPRGELFTGNKEGYQTFLSLCAHELLHAWHVKRVQPQVLTNPSLQREVHSPQLWIYEGFTSLYDDLSVARAGGMSPQDYAAVLAKNITRYLRNPGAKHQSVAQSSFDAWTKFYQQTPMSTNFITSYYNTGGLIALCLDLLLRSSSNNRVTLDDVMRVLWNQYGKTGLGTPDDVIAQICRDELQIPIDSFIDKYVTGTEPLPLEYLLPYIGLAMKVRPSTGMDDKGHATEREALSIEFGAQLVAAEVGMKVVSVLHQSEASIAGLLQGDLLIAINHRQVNAKHLTASLNMLKDVIDSKVDLAVLRDGRLLHLNMKVTPALGDTCDIEIIDNAVFLRFLGIDTD